MFNTKICKCARAALPHPYLLQKAWLINGPLHILNFSSTRPTVSEIQKRGHICTCARAMCRCTLPMACVTCIAAWSLITHQMWSLSAEPFLSYSLAAKFDTPHPARATCQGDPPNEPSPIVNNLNGPTSLWGPHVDLYFCTYKLFKSVATPGRSLILATCPLFEKELRFALRAPLVITS